MLPDTPPDEAAIERVAKALYNHQVGEARRRIDLIHFEADDIHDLAVKLVSESETVQILIFYSYLDDRIQNLLTHQMVAIDSAKARDQLFGINGPLSTFNARTLLAYHLEWLSKEQKLRLDAFRKVRNEFAHRAFKVSISDPIVAQQLSLIDYDVRMIIGRSFDAAQYRLDGLNSLLCKLIFLAFRTFEELLIFPTAKAFQVEPSSICPTFNEQPDIIRRIARAMAKAIITAGRLEEKNDASSPTA
jgi:hypothetical protein